MSFQQMARLFSPRVGIPCGRRTYPDIHFYCYITYMILNFISDVGFGRVNEGTKKPSFTRPNLAHRFTIPRVCPRNAIVMCLHCTQYGEKSQICSRAIGEWYKFEDLLILFAGKVSTYNTLNKYPEDKRAKKPYNESPSSKSIVRLRHIAWHLVEIFSFLRSSADSGLTCGGLTTCPPLTNDATLTSVPAYISFRLAS